MKLIIGLGNPEKKYDGTRHNVGFAVLDSYARLQGSNWKDSQKFKAMIAELPDQNLLVKPTTYYNLVGESVQAVASFYKIDPRDILIVHDDLALPLGVVRTRLGGSPAGNNGIKSIIQHMGEETARLRIGTYTDHPASMDDAAFVLSKFNGSEQKILENQLPAIFTIIREFCGGNFTTTTHNHKHPAADP